MKMAYVFPGQGSQWVGMGRDLYDGFAAARVVFEQADETIGFPLSRLCFEGPEEDLRQAINAQPAIVTVSFACLKAIEEVAANNRLPSPAFVAGHSLGEYTALAAANVADFATIVYLARERGRLMHEAGLKEPGGMVAIIGMAEASLAQVCRETGTWVANINYPGQLVISGANQNLAKAVELARARGAHRAIPLAVSGAFHTSIMQPAVDGMRGILATLNFRDPAIPVVANTSASPLTAAEEIKDELIRQLLNCVRWQQSIENMIRDEVDTFIEVGPGKVLTGIIKRIDKNVRTLSIGDAEAVRGLGNSSISMTPFS